MDKKSEHKWRVKQFRLRSSVFLRRNGLQLLVIGCLAATGVAAVLVFSPDREEKNPPDTSVLLPKDQRLSEVLNTIAPDPQVVLPVLTIEPTMPVPTMAVPTLVPDFTAQPEVTFPPDSGLNFEPPVDGEVIRVFAMNSLIYSKTLNQWMTHPGVDIACSKGDEVRSIAKGTVDNVYQDDMFGVTVVIKHENGLVSVYSNLKDDVTVKIGDAVESRDVIGYVGDTAICECLERSHIHFEIIVNDVHVNPEGLITFIKNK